jgi:hypothetical protein
MSDEEQKMMVLVMQFSQTFVLARKGFHHKHRSLGHPTER